MRSMVLAAATCVVVMPGVSHAQNLLADAAQSTQKDLDQLAATLNDTSATEEQRAQAAKRLASRGSRDADDILLQALGNFGNRPAQLAAADAIASDTIPDPRMVGALGGLLGSDPEMTRAAARALAVYKTNTVARDRLIQFANNLSQQTAPRIAVIRAMGRLLDKVVAGALVELMSGDRSPAIRDAAADALIEMTDLRSHGRDVQRWREWWEAARAQSEYDWARDLLNRNAARAAELQQQMESLQRATEQIIVADLRDKPEELRTRSLLEYLKSESEKIRVLAVQIVYNSISSQPRLPAPILEFLRGMVGDNSPEVRDRVARTLAAAAPNDPAAVTALLTQLAQEKDPEVRAAIAESLGPAHDLRAVPPLLETLNDESFGAARAAANALRDLAGQLREPAQAQLATQVARALQDRLQGTESNISAQPLRESLVEALARLADPGSMQTFYRLITPDERSVRVRVAALQGLGALGKADSANQIASALNDPEPRVRMAAVEALGTTGTFENVQALSRHLVDTVESSQEVRDAVWRVLAGDVRTSTPGLFEKASPRELNLWIERFRDDPRRRVAVMQIAESKLQAASAHRDLAFLRQSMGETLLQLGEPESLETAVMKLRQAIDYWTGENAPQTVTEELMEQLARALLRARKYPEFVQFASAAVNREKANNESIYKEIVRETERLQNANDLDSALRVLQAAREIPFVALYAGLVQQREKEIQAARSARGNYWMHLDFLLNGPVSHLRTA